MPTAFLLRLTDLEAKVKTFNVEKSRAIWAYYEMLKNNPSPAQLEVALIQLRGANVSNSDLLRWALDVGLFQPQLVRSPAHDSEKTRKQEMAS
jgi:hypothetical protein